MREYRADFTITCFTDSAVYIEDNDGELSVTNDAEAVVKYLDGKFYNRRIFYRDTMGSWDELVHSNGKFLKFAPSNLTDREVHDIMTYGTQKLQYH
jgi:hypothetical protein